MGTAWEGTDKNIGEGEIGGSVAVFKGFIQGCRCNCRFFNFFSNSQTVLGGGERNLENDWSVSENVFIVLVT